jgi:hypothetical protein
MHGDDSQQEGMFSYVSPEKRVPADHPVRPIRKMVDEILKELHGLRSRTPRWTGAGLNLANNVTVKECPATSDIRHSNAAGLRALSAATREVACGPCAPAILSFPPSIRTSGLSRRACSLARRGE